MSAEAGGCAGYGQERDKQRALVQRQGAAILAEQLKEREVEHLRQEDLLHQVHTHSLICMGRPAIVIMKVCKTSMLLSYPLDLGQTLGLHAVFQV